MAGSTWMIVEQKVYSYLRFVYSCKINIMCCVHSVVMQDTPPEQKHMNAGTILPKEMCWGYENLRTGAICIERSLEGFV